MAGGRLGGRQPKWRQGRRRCSKNEAVSESCRTGTQCNQHASMRHVCTHVRTNLQAGPEFRSMRPAIVGSALESRIIITTASSSENACATKDTRLGARRAAGPRPLSVRPSGGAPSQRTAGSDPGGSLTTAGFVPRRFSRRATSPFRRCPVGRSPSACSEKREDTRAVVEPSPRAHGGQAPWACAIGASFWTLLERQCSRLACRCTAGAVACQPTRPSGTLGAHGRWSSGSATPFRR